MAKKKSKPKSKLLSDWAPKYMCSASGSMTDHPLSHEARADIAVKENPLNKPRIPAKMKEMATPAFVSLVTQKWWGADKTTFTIYFATSNVAVKDRIIKFMNVWNEDSALNFKWTNDRNAADFRCGFLKQGYYSYIGTDCLSIPKNQFTMNLQGFDSLSVPDRELMRVAPHEGWHAVGGPHEHSRQSIIDLLDRQKTIAQMKIETGWSEQQIIQQVFTVMKESAIFGTAPDATSIACYFFSGRCTKSGLAIPGGNTLSKLDRAFGAKTWPKVGVPPIIVPPAVGKYTAVLFTPDQRSVEMVEKT